MLTEHYILHWWTRHICDKDPVEMHYVYLVHSNPEGDLTNLRDEVAVVNNSISTDVCRPYLIYNASTSDIIKGVIEHKDRYIFHYCGHSAAVGPALTDGTANGVSLYKLLSDFEILFLNGCYTKTAIDSLIESVDLSRSKLKVIISTRTAVYDNLAVSFAQFFYGSFKNGETVASSFEKAFDAMQALPEAKTRSFESRETRGILTPLYEQDKEYYEILYLTDDAPNLTFRTSATDHGQNYVCRLLEGLLGYMDTDRMIDKRKVLAANPGECTAALTFLKSVIFPFARPHIQAIIPRDEYDMPDYSGKSLDLNRTIQICDKIYQVLINTLCHVALADVWDKVLRDDVLSDGNLPVLDAVTKSSINNFLFNPDSASIETLKTIEALLEDPFLPGLNELAEKIDESCAFFQFNHHSPGTISETIDNLSIILGSCSLLFRGYEFKSIGEIKYMSLRHYNRPGMSPQHSSHQESQTGLDEKIVNRPYFKYRLHPFEGNFTVVKPYLEQAPVACESVYLYKPSGEALVVSPFIIDIQCKTDGQQSFGYFKMFDNSSNKFIYTSINIARNDIREITQDNDYGDLYDENLYPQIQDLIHRVGPV